MRKKFTVLDLIFSIANFGPGKSRFTYWTKTSWPAKMTA